MAKSDSDTMIIFDRDPLSIEQIVAIAKAQTPSQLSQSTDFRQCIAKGSAFLDTLLKDDGVIYGVTTGYGDSCTISIPSDLVQQLPHNLYTFHGCGLGNNLTKETARAVLAVRLKSLCQGHSGVSEQLLEQIDHLLAHDVIPVIPEEGSVGASGDLTPLSYVAAVLCGERDVYYKSEVRPAREALEAEGISPIILRPKEGLAIMNGTAVMTGIACLAFDRATYVSKLAARVTAMATIVSKGNAHHFDEILFSVKPHPGQQRVAARLRDDLHAGEPPRNPQRLQDRYSLRCAPHVIGAMEDAFPWLRQLIENELNSANDNPIIDGEGEHVLHGGHFYGGHIALAMDTMKNTIANVADLLDRQLALMVDTKFNHGLPANLSGANAERTTINHGFKAVQIAVSAWTAEALKLTMPASVFSRSTECYNQDKVSMGTIAARDCIRVLELTEQVCAALLLACCQGLDLRKQQGELDCIDLSPAIEEMQESIRLISDFVTEDRALEGELRQTIDHIRAQSWTLYENIESA